jgi:23S rRNA (adenine1618-N6)-methyltransferase
VSVNAHGDASIDFSNPHAVKALNQALLAQVYGINHWDIPEHYLCPAIPGRADYVHYLADLIKQTKASNVPQGSEVRVLDIGVGANAIYPLIGTKEYGWQFVGADIDTVAIDNAQRVIHANGLENAISLRLQNSPSHYFKGIIHEGEKFTLSMCNPPFHASLTEAHAGTNRKWQGLQKAGAKGQAKSKKPINNSNLAPVLNFGGQNNELVCEGGEEAFLNGMIKESTQFAMQCLWFTTLVSKASTLPYLNRTLAKANARQVRTIEMRQGQKQSRILAWSWLVR